MNGVPAPICPRAGSQDRKSAKDDGLRRRNVLDLAQLLVPGLRRDAVFHEEQVIALRA